MSVQSQKKSDRTLVSALTPKICDYIGTPYIFTTRCLGAARQRGKGWRGVHCGIMVRAATQRPS